MNCVAKFIIDDQHYIEVLVPPFGEKENSFCDPIAELHNCDVITAYLVTPLARYIVYKDQLQSFISSTESKMSHVLSDKKNIFKNMKVATIGYLYNVENYHLSGASFDYFQYWLWSTSVPNGGVQSWIYRKDDVIYLEVTPMYPWLHIEPPIADDKELFQKFIDNYKPMLCTELSPFIIKTWVDQCKYLDETIDRPSKRKS